MSIAENMCVIVPARGGSKGIPGKNIKLLGRETLVGWSIKIAQDIPNIGLSHIYLSTDCEDIAKEGSRHDAQIIERPRSLAQDDSTVISMIDHHLELFQQMGHSYEILIYLEPTSPFRTRQEILNCVKTLNTENYDSVATFAETEFNVSELLTRNPDGSLGPVDRRLSEQTILEKSYVLSGAVYAFKVDSYMRQRPAGIFFGNRGHVIQSSPHIDIDEPYDLAKAKNILQSLSSTYWDKLDLI
jgi:CMP-N-acetylneuraminic acid synthetase